MANADDENRVIAAHGNFDEIGASTAKAKSSAFSPGTVLTGLVVGLVFWTYSLVSVFVTNVDWTLQEYMPAYLAWLIQFKSLVLLLTMSVTWIGVGTKRLILLLCLILFLPIIVFVLLSWVIGKYALQSKSWIVVLALVESATSFVTNIKLRFISFTVLLIATTYVIAGNNKHFISAAAITILALVVMTYVRSFMAAISPPSTFKLLRRFLAKDESIRFKALRLDDEVRGKPIASLTATELTKWNNVLQTSVLYNRALLLYARTMRDYQRSNLLFIPGIFTMFRLIFFTVLGFSFVNFALFRIDPTNFKVLPSTAMFGFFYYSFNSLILNGIDDVKPSSMLAQSILMLQQLLSFVLALIMVSLFVSYRTQRASSDLDNAIQIAEQEANTVEGWMQREFKVASVARAIDHLKQVEGNLVGFIHWLSRGI